MEKNNVKKVIENESTEITNEIEKSNIPEIEKPNIPIEVAIEDIKKAIVELINISGLPTCIISIILSELSSQYNAIVKDVTNQKRTEYNNKLNEWKNSQK